MPAGAGWAADISAWPIGGGRDLLRMRMAEWPFCLMATPVVQALGGASPVGGASPAAAAGQESEPVFRGFGSPLKQVGWFAVCSAEGGTVPQPSLLGICGGWR